MHLGGCVKKFRIQSPYNEEPLEVLRRPVASF